MLITVGVSILTSSFDVAITNIALPDLGREFDVEPDVILWVSVIYLLASLGLSLTFGSLGDAIGRKQVFLRLLLFGTRTGGCHTETTTSTCCCFCACMQGSAGAVSLQQRSLVWRLFLRRNGHGLSFWRMSSWESSLDRALVGGILLEGIG